MIAVYSRGYTGEFAIGHPDGIGGDEKRKKDELNGSIMTSVRGAENVGAGRRHGC